MQRLSKEQERSLQFLKSHLVIRYSGTLGDYDKERALIKADILKSTFEEPVKQAALIWAEQWHVN